MTNGERLKYLREKNGYTQKDIATKLGLESAAISKYELDMREPNIEAIKKLAEIFNVSIDYLLGRTPDVFINESDKETLNLSLLKEKFNQNKLKMKNAKDIYEWLIPVTSAANELCCGVGFTSYGYSNINGKVSMLEIEEILNDFNNSPMPNPQIILQIKSLPKSIMIIEINAIDEDPLPFDAIDRIALFTAKLSQEYNVLGLAIAVDKKENCKLIDAIYQKNNEPYYTQLHLPKTVLTAHEYIDIMSRL